MAEERGLYGKYTVINNETGERVAHCFVLRPDRDVVALRALEEYARRCWRNEQLRDDLRAWVAELWRARHAANNEVCG